jgi:hypothetical protein
MIVVDPLADFVLRRFRSLQWLGIVSYDRFPRISIIVEPKEGLLGKEM